MNKQQALIWAIRRWRMHGDPDGVLRNIICAVMDNLTEDQMRDAACEAREL